jgi:hypothetical protein
LLNGSSTTADVRPPNSGRCHQGLETVVGIVEELLLDDEAALVVAVEHHVHRAQTGGPDREVEEDPRVGPVVGDDGPLVEGVSDAVHGGDGQSDEFQSPVDTDDPSGPSEETGGGTEVDDVLVIQESGPGDVAGGEGGGEYRLLGVDGLEADGGQSQWMRDRGQKPKVARPTMSDSSIGPWSRLSSEEPRLSPMTKTSPLGIF